MHETTRSRALQRLRSCNDKLASMTVLRAHVENGRIIADDPTDLPDGTLLHVVPVSDGEMDAEERAALEQSIEEGARGFREGRRSRRVRVREDSAGAEVKFEFSKRAERDARRIDARCSPQFDGRA